ncbi:MAG: nucleoside phosphorylase [Bacteroidota bacterium]
MPSLSPSELILHPDGSIYHLHLHPEQVAPTIILVGDPERVPLVSRHFDRIEERVQKREFVTHTGWRNDRRLSVVSTGIGTDNIDIVLNELDALFNIDLRSREVKSELTQLDLIRIGTSGSLQPDLPVDSYLASGYGLGLEGLLHYYSLANNAEETLIQLELMRHAGQGFGFPLRPYLVGGSETLRQEIAYDFPTGITATCSGFYAPQGRQLRLPSQQPDLLPHLRGFRYESWRITNFEMETAGIYGLARLLGHRALSLNALLANRVDQTFSPHPQRTVERLIEMTLERLSS